MKSLFFSMAFLFGHLSLVPAQDFYLPVSTTSESAKAAYYQAEQLASNLHIWKAIAQLDKALEADPNFFMAYVLKIYYTSGEQQAALIDRALTIDVCAFNEAERVVRQQLERWDQDPKAKTGETMKTLVAAYPETPQAYHWACLLTAYTDKDADAALEYAIKLAELNPDFAPNYNNLGYLYLEKSQMKEAKAAFEKYIDLLPNEANPYDSMAEYYMVNQDYGKSAEYYERAAMMGMVGSKARADEVLEKVNN